jgi:hypothetical protein
MHSEQQEDNSHQAEQDSRNSEWQQRVATASGNSEWQQRVAAASGKADAQKRKGGKRLCAHDRETCERGASQAARTENQREKTPPSFFSAAAGLGAGLAGSH